jgi:hypothetical protein
MLSTLLVRKAGTSVVPPISKPMRSALVPIAASARTGVTAEVEPDPPASEKQHDR